VSRTIVHDGELLRHPPATRVLHWAVAIFFVLALLSGFAIYTPWLYHCSRRSSARAGDAGAAPVVQPRLPRRVRGTARELGAADVVDARRSAVAAPSEGIHLQRRVARAGLRRFLQRGQKLYFWLIVASAAIFLLSACRSGFHGRLGRRSPRSATSCTTSPRCSCSSGSSSTSTKGQPRSRARSSR